MSNGPVGPAAQRWEGVLRFAILAKEGWHSWVLLSAKMNSDIRSSLFSPNVQVLRAEKRAALKYNIEHRAAK